MAERMCTLLSAIAPKVPDLKFKPQILYLRDRASVPCSCLQLFPVSTRFLGRQSTVL